MSLIFLAGLTSAGYVFLGVILLSFLIAYIWLKASGKKEKLGCFSIGLTAIIIWFVLMFPVYFSLEIIKYGIPATKIGLAIFWILAFGLLAYVILSKNRKKVKDVVSLIFRNVLYLIILGLFLTLLGGMVYYVYLSLFTHEKDDAPIWTVLLCIFFVASLVLAAFGVFIQSKEAKKKEKTTFYSLKEAQLKPEAVIELNLSNAKIDEFPVAIFQFRNLKFLILSNNNITEIPNDVNKLKLLMGIDLSNNPISDLERNKIRKLLSKDVEIVF